MESETTTAAEPPFDPTAAALREAVIDLEAHVARHGWDGPVAVFALVNTATAIARTPSLAEQLPAESVQAAADNPAHLTSIEQDGLPQAADIEQLLAQLAWPAEVDGAAIVVERVVLPPEAERPDATVDDLLNHPGRQDVRLAVGVLRSGHSWCALRSKANDSDDAVGGSVDAVPGLVEALATTLAD